MSNKNNNTNLYNNQKPRMDNKVVDTLFTQKHIKRYWQKYSGIAYLFLPCFYNDNSVFK